MNNIVDLSILRSGDGWRLSGAGPGRTFRYRIDAEDVALAAVAEAKARGAQVSLTVQEIDGRLRKLGPTGLAFLA